MSQIIDAVKRYLDAEGLRYAVQDEWILVPMCQENGKWQVLITECNDCLLCSSHFPVHVPADRRAAVMELFTRWNYALLIGNWEMNLGNGEVRYRTSVPLGGMELTEELARQICGINSATISHGFADLLSVALQGRSFEELEEERARVRAETQAGFEESMRKLGFDDGPGESGMNEAA